MSRKYYENKPIDVTLDCKHVLTFRTYPPKRAERVWCVRCQDLRAVAVAPAEWRVKCANCRLARRFGQSREDAERLGAAHHNRRQHTVTLLDGYAKVHVWQGNSARVVNAETRQEVAQMLGIDLPTVTKP